MWFNCSAVDEAGEAHLSLFQRVAYTLVFAVGLPLNISALWLFSRIPNWTSTHVYMFNLLLADFLLILFLPFRIFETFCQMKPTNFCTFLICVHYSNMYVSIFTITAISAHRYMAIRFPLWVKSLEDRRKTIANIVCVFIWMTIMIICTSFLSDMYPDKLRKCYERKSKMQLKLSFLLVLEIVGYLLPMVIVTICSSQAIYVVLKSTDNADEKNAAERKRVAAIITANMIIFTVCFTPIHVGYLLKYSYHPEPFSEVTFSHAFFEVSEWMATTNCCLDAVGYYLLLKKVFRDKC